MGWIYAAPFAGFSLLALRYFLSLFGTIDRYANMDSLVSEKANGESR
jgi:TRAP-type C4-dicarboxylate transport system permease small subunit